MKSKAFNEMIQVQKEYERLKNVKVEDEMKETLIEYQRIIMDVEEIYGRFLYLLKLIVSLSRIHFYNSSSSSGGRVTLMMLLSRNWKIVKRMRI